MNGGCWLISNSFFVLKINSSLYPKENFLFAAPIDNGIKIMEKGKKL